MQAETHFVPLHRAAAQLGLPISWLKGEADARRIPSLRAGRRILLNVDAVTRVLEERAGDHARTAEAAHA